MSKHTHDAVATDIERLIREGELYRIKVVHAKALVAQALQPDALMHGAVDHAVGLAQARLGGLFQPGGLSKVNFKAVMPYAISIGSFIARKRLIKPVLGVVALAGAGVAWLLHRKSSSA
ncbi:MAG: hypothetical protein ABW202_17440 [Duganella sp.]